MRKLATLLLIFLSVYQNYAQQKIRVHRSGNVMYAKEITAVDSIKLDNTYAKFKLSDATSTLDFQKVMVDSLTFTNNAVTLDKIYIIYNGNDNATIINPYANQGITITATAGTVVATAASGISNLEYNILGSSANGSLTLTTDTPVNLVLNNLTLTNPSGAAFSISGAQTTNIYLTSGTTNTLTDGAASTKNGTITTNGAITIQGSGNMIINGVKKHGINTSSSITINNGTTTIASAANDGLHSEGFSMTGGTLTVTSSVGDGVDAGDTAINISGGTLHITSTSADVKGLKTGNNTITISGGQFTLNVSGAQSKAISAKGNVTIDNGTFNITLSGATVLTASGSGYDPSYCSGIKSDALITVNNGTFNINAQSGADGGKGFSAGSDINVNGGNITVSTAGNGGTFVNTLGVADSYSTSSFSSDTQVNIAGGTLTLTNTGKEGKGISADVDINISGSPQITITNSGQAGKGFKADGNVIFNGGTTQINLSGAVLLATSGSGYNPSYPTGIKTTGQITVNSGAVTVQGTSAATGARGLSGDAGITVNGGTISTTLAGNGAVYTNTLGTTDSYAAAGLSSDTNIAVIGGTLTTSSSGTGGKGIKADGTITIGNATSNPTLNITTTGARFLVSGTDYNHPKTIVAAGAVSVANGTLTINSTDDGIHSDTTINISGGNNTINAISTVQGVGEGIESAIINISGGLTKIVASNDGINGTYGTQTGGTEQNDNSLINITGGTIISNTTNGDAIDGNGNFQISGGIVVANGPASGVEEALDVNGSINANGGILITGGTNSNMTPNFSATSTQRNMWLKSSSALSSTSILHIRTSTGTEMVTFKPKNNAYYFHFTSPNISGGTSYQVYFGGSYTGGTFVGGSSTWGMYTGGTYSTTGATLKKTFTTSSTTTTNTVTF